MKYEKVQVQYENHQKAAKLERQHYNQVGSIYFKSAFSVHLFGVCKTEGGQNHQLNFVIGEGELPKSTSKDANTTINMVYYALQKFALSGKKHLQITYDNCSEQNKNNLSLWFWSWLVMLSWYEDITVNFMIFGHTKFICDSFFGHIKKAYWKHRVNIIDDVKNIINNSSEGNEAILYNNRANWNCSNDIGKVNVSKESGEEESCFKLLNSDNFDKNGKSDLIDTTLLIKE